LADYSHVLNLVEDLSIVGPRERDIDIIVKGLVTKCRHGEADARKPLICVKMVLNNFVASFPRSLHTHIFKHPRPPSMAVLERLLNHKPKPSWEEGSPTNLKETC